MSDILKEIREVRIDDEGMKVDRMLFDRFAGARCERMTPSETAVEAGQWDRVLDYVNREVFNKPEDYYTLEKLRRAAAVDRRVTLREIMEKVFDLIPEFKSKDELLEEEFSKFVTDHTPQRSASIPAIRHFFKAYITNGITRDAVDKRRFVYLATDPVFSIEDYRAVPKKYRTLVPEYIKDYVSLNQFAA